MAYAELLARSNFSLLEGASQPEELVQAASAMGLAALGLADRDGVYGVVRAHREARDAPGLKLVVGATLTLTDAPPVTLLVADRRGWSGLSRLISGARGLVVERQDGGAARDRGVVKGHATVGVQTLAASAPGLYAVLHQGWDAAAAEPLRQAFGERLRVLLTRRLSPADRHRDAWAHGLAAALRAPLLASAEPLFHDPARKRVSDVLTCIRRRTTLERAGQDLQANAERCLLPEAMFRRRFADAPAAIQAGLDLAEACTFSLDELEYRYPPEVVPDGHTPMAWLRELTERGLAWRYPAGVPPEVNATAAHELDIIAQLDFPAYFLTVHDIVRFARSRGILCQGRGSAANSVVCYALGVTAVDPSSSSLLFERFLSVERGEPPDIDVDFEHERREEVFQYVYARYGRDRAGLVNEVIAWRLRSAVRDVGKVFGLSLDQVDRLARGVDRWSAGPLADGDALIAEAGLDPDSLAVRQTLELSAELRRFPRHISQHVGGFVISAGPLVDLVPLEPAAMDARTVLQWDKDDIDVLGFVKVDLLALGMLTAIRKAFELIEGFSDQTYTLASVPREDPLVYDMICSADTVGVFQIESRAQMSMLPRLKPRCFYDLVIEVAIVRPGPIQGGMVHPYLRRRSGHEAVTYAHPALVPILERTLGVPLFQEQVMQMASAVGGFTPGQADELRRAMGAWRKRGKLDLLGRKLVEGMVSHGIARSYAESVFQQILGFGEYGFPESHAASFAHLVYVSAWLRRHHRAAFIAALLNSQPMGFYSPRALVADAQRAGVEVRPVCASASAWGCTLEAGEGGAPALRLGLQQVHGLAQAAGERLLAARSQAPWRDLHDLARRAGLATGDLQLLAQADAFAGFGLARREAVWTLQGLWTDLPLFAGLHRDEPAPALPVEAPLDELQADYAAMGLSIVHHPIGLLREGLASAGVQRIVDAKLARAGARIRIAGLVQSRQRPGTQVVFMTLEDETGMFNLVIRPEVWERHRTLARSARLLRAEGQLQRDGEAVSLLVSALLAVQDDPGVVVRSRDFH